MKSALAIACLIFGSYAHAEMSLGSPNGSSTSLSPNTSTSLGSSPTVTTIPQGGTSAGSPQTSGPLNSAPNGAGGTYGYPNNANDPNTVNPGLQQPTFYNGPYSTNGQGTESGATTSVNPAGAPFVTPPATVVQPINGNPTMVTPGNPTGVH